MSSGVVCQIPLEEEYKKPTGVTPQDIKKLREWLSTQPHLPGEHITDLDLILAYYSSRCSPELAKKQLDTHYTLKTLMANFFKDRAVDDVVEKILNVILVQPLAARTKEGYAVLYMRYLDLDPQKYNVVHVARAAFMLIDLWQYEEGTWPGLVLAIDMEGSTFSHVTKWDMQTLQQFIHFLQEAMFITMKAFHFLNATSFMDRIMTMIKTFMKKSRQDILHVHQAGSKSVENFFPTEALPKEAGGNYKSCEECKNDIIAKLKANKEFFDKENKKRVVEERRPGKPKTMSDFSGGVEGSFKTLSID